MKALFKEISCNQSVDEDEEVTLECLQSKVFDFIIFIIDPKFNEYRKQLKSGMSTTEVLNSSNPRRATSVRLQKKRNIPF